MELESDRPRRIGCVGITDVVREALALAIECKTCGHRRVVDAEPLWRLARVRRWPDGLADVGRHLRCSDCQAKWPSVAATTEPPDGPRPIGPASATDARRDANRLRC